MLFRSPRVFSSDCSMRRVVKDSPTWMLSGLFSGGEGGVRDRRGASNSLLGSTPDTSVKATEAMPPTVFLQERSILGG